MHLAGCYLVALPTEAGSPRSPLLVLSPIMPARTGNGLAMRVASFLEAASAAHEPVVAVVPISGELPVAPAAEFARVVAVPPGASQTARSQLARLLGERRWRELLARAEPMPQAARLASPALADEVVRAAGVAPGTAVHVVRSYLAPLGLAVAERLSAPWATLDLDDDDEAVSEGESGSYRRLTSAFAPLFSLVSLASHEEAERVACRHGLRAVALPNVVEAPPALPSRRPSGDVVLFVGNLTYRPNVEAVLSLADDVLPAVRARSGLPVTALVVGNYARPGPLAWLEERPEVSLQGFVADLSSAYDRADVVVAPLKTGSGTRLKLLEAFAHGVPVVTTPRGACGLDVRHGEHLLVAATPEGLAAHIVTLLRQPLLADELASAAFEFVRRHHSMAVLTADVSAMLRSARAIGRPAL